MPTDYSPLRLLPPPNEAEAGAPPDEGPNNQQDEAAASQSAPWNEGDFSPFPEPEQGGYVAEGGETFRIGPGGTRGRVCGFVPEPLAERTIIHNLDDPSSDRTYTVTVRVTTPAGDDSVVDVPVEKGRNIANAIIEAVPSSVAQLSVSKRADVARAAAAFTSPTFESRTLYGQTGWTPDGWFVCPGSDDVSLTRLGTSPGLGLLAVPPFPDPTLLAVGADVLLRIYQAASMDVAAGVLGTIAAGPMFRQPGHLGARACTSIVVGPTGVGKSLLVSRAYSLLGGFARQPGCIATFRTTLPTLEAYLHTLRDLPVYIDNFRLADPGARETFRALAISIGDGTGRGRSSGHRVVGAARANSLLLATGEDAFTDDAAVSARLLEFHADHVDRAALLKLDENELVALPHLFSGFLHYLRLLPPAAWARRRANMKILGDELLRKTGARTSEHLALIATAFVSLCEYLSRFAGRPAVHWEHIAESFLVRVPDIAAAQANRVRDERVDQVILREIARALREGRARLQAGSATASAGAGALLGAFDSDFLYLIPDVTARWASAALRSRAHAGAVGRKGLLWALQARGGENGSIRWRTIDGRRTRAWVVRRDGLGEGAEWDGLLQELPPRRGAPPEPSGSNP